MRHFIVPVPGQTNWCPKKPGAVQLGHPPLKRSVTNVSATVRRALQPPNRQFAPTASMAALKTRIPAACDNCGMPLLTRGKGQERVLAGWKGLFRKVERAQKDTGAGGGRDRTLTCGVPYWNCSAEAPVIRNPTLAHTRAPRVTPDARSRARLEAIADLLDSRWHIPGTGIRFGADALLSLLPGLGPIVSTTIPAY
ncbi:DUF4112 domain-containing protein [Roseicella frigidaeris]|uniref:DUF4112 domain-containing protein n=1 Tax=Roseicella frigidaeris TaxID=2230885 RepID=UPI0038D031B3